MERHLLCGLALFHGLNAAVMWSLPRVWYDTIPGVVETGGFNTHFVRDIALVFALSGAALWAGARQDNRSLALFGAGWPVMHALFHLWIWGMHRGAALDLVAFTNLLGIQLPGWLGLWMAVRLPRREVAL